jgi:hypothetical protein
MKAPRWLWLALCAALCVIAAQYAAYAVAAIGFPFGLDYSEGLIWQQALWLGTAKLYGDIGNFPFLVCDYPPLYLIVLRCVHALGIGMLPGGRLVSVLSMLVICVLTGAVVFRHAMRIGAKGPALIAGVVGGLLPLSLLPVASWSVLMRVDQQALALTYAGIACAMVAFRRPAWLAPALLFFVASAFTKQTYLAAPAAMFPVLLIRAPRQTLAAYAAGLALGLALLGVCSWATDGRFLQHIIAYAADTADPIVAFKQTGLWLAAYPLDAGLTLVAVIVLWRQDAVRPKELVRAIRSDEGVAWRVFLTIYLLLTTIMLITVGKIGSSRNYFIEWMCCWCLWLGCLAATAMGRPGALRYAMPALLLRRADWGALLARVRGVPGPLLSDDMVLTLQAGRPVEMEPGILLEMARMGRWDEQRLIDKLNAHYFGAVITAYDPGDPTFDARYLPRTQAALLADYPHVQRFGDYRLRLP